MIEILEKKLYSEKEAIEAVNKAFGDNALNSRMLSYMRDIRGLVPKPIRIKVSKGKGGAHSFYTEETMQCLKKILEEKTRFEKTLKDIQIQYADMIERTKISTEVFRQQYAQLAKVHKDLHDAFKPAAEAAQKIGEAMRPAIEAAQKMRDAMNPSVETTQKLVRQLDEMKKALENNSGINKLNKIYEEISFLYNKKLRSSLEKIAKQEVVQKLNKEG